MARVGSSGRSPSTSHHTTRRSSSNAASRFPSGVKTTQRSTSSFRNDPFGSGPPSSRATRVPRRTSHTSILPLTRQGPVTTATWWG
jgi:hypothetical protein